MSDIRVELQAQIERKHQGCLNTADYTVTSNGSPFALRDRIGKGGCLSECLCTDFEGEIKLSQANSSCNAEIMAFELLLHDLGIQGGWRCDFVIAPKSGNEYIVFCELTLSKVDYVAPFIAKREEDKQEKKSLGGQSIIRPIISVAIQSSGVLRRESLSLTINTKRPSLAGGRVDQRVRIRRRKICWALLAPEASLMSFMRLWRNSNFKWFVILK